MHGTLLFFCFTNNLHTVKSLCFGRGPKWPFTQEGWFLVQCLLRDKNVAYKRAGLGLGLRLFFENSVKWLS